MLRDIDVKKVKALLEKAQQLMEEEDDIEIDLNVNHWEVISLVNIMNEIEKYHIGIKPVEVQNAYRTSRKHPEKYLVCGCCKENKLFRKVSAFEGYCFYTGYKIDWKGHDLEKGE